MVDARPMEEMQKDSIRYTTTRLQYTTNPLLVAEWMSCRVSLQKFHSTHSIVPAVVDHATILLNQSSLFTEYRAALCMSCFTYSIVQRPWLRKFLHLATSFPKVNYLAFFGRRICLAWCNNANVLAKTAFIWHMRKKPLPAIAMAQQEPYEIISCSQRKKTIYIMLI